MPGVCIMRMSLPVVAVSAAAVFAVSACGGAEASEEHDIVVDYLEEQAASTGAVLEGDESALGSVEDLNAEYVRYYDGEPGDPDGEWVEANAWMAVLADCVEEIDDPDLCRVVTDLYSVSADLAYWFDDEAAAEDEYWEEDRPEVLAETEAAVEEARELVE